MSKSSTILPSNVLEDVRRYLEAEGYVCTKSTLNRHKSGGKISPNKDGVYTMRIADKYARSFLKRRESGKTLSREIEELQRRKAEAEVHKIESQREELDLKLARMRGELVKRGDMEMELASRAGVLEQSLKHFIRSRVSDLVFLVGGEAAKAGDLRERLEQEVDAALDEYARTDNFTVVFDV